MALTLREARCRFTIALCEFVIWIYRQGYEVAFDEVTDRITVKDPTTDHMKGSVHEIGLAADLLLYKDGVYLTETAAYKSLGEKWETMGQQRGLPLVWGGRFVKNPITGIGGPDGNHFSCKWEGKS